MAAVVGRGHGGPSAVSLRPLLGVHPQCLPLHVEELGTGCPHRAAAMHPLRSCPQVMEVGTQPGQRLCL